MSAPTSSAVNLALTNPAGFTEVGYASAGFITWGAALVFFMIPGLGLVYSGLARGKNALTMVTWVIWGFSLAFSDTGGVFIGNLQWAGFTSIGSQPLVVTTWVPAIVFAVYQMQFAAITPAIIFGSAAERFSLVPALIFVFIWATLIYDPIAYWTWSQNGWIRNFSCISDAAANKACLIGGLDFAGGGPVHISSGFAGLAYAIVLGKRKKESDEPHKPHNLNLVILGTSMLWFGWFGFNGGSALASTARAGMAATVTTIAAATAGLSWSFFDYIFTKKFSAIGFCSGAIAGLVGITPAAGFVAPWAAIVIGFVTAIACNLGSRAKHLLGYDDALDAFGLHGIGGFVGNILTGVFAQKWIALLDGTVIPGGAIEGNWIQLAYQLGGSAAIAGYSFVGTLIICYAINFIPGMKLRVDDDHELLGVDVTHMGEVAYDHYDGLDGEVPTKEPIA
ncbi:hypothetical protein HK098_007050 [Nowakowskiella sp. JEL0407]|nr:hypothetical protein HK098_007050 [Nowakowskiella sp. JEL0407]